MAKRNWRHILLLTLLVVLAAILLLWSRPAPQARLERVQLADGSPLILANPAGTVNARVLLALPPGQWLPAAELLALAQHSNARLLQIALPDNDCAAQQRRFNAASRYLEGQPTLVAGIGPGAAFAWRWLAGQTSDQAHALSIDFNLKHPDCPAPLPTQAAHGHWSIAWNDNPDDASARFARDQQHADTRISAYDTSLPQLLKEQLQQLLQGQSESMPLVEVPASKPADTLTLFYSGDGGWRDLDRDVATELAKHGVPVVGIDALRYFWQHRSPEQGAVDLSRLMHTYREKWGSKRFVLAGYSFGADVLPAFYNRLPQSDQQRVDAILLLGLARSGNFEIEVQGWLGKQAAEAATAPELLKLPAPKVLCVYGSEEAGASGCTQPGAPGEILRLPGGHHYDENYPALADRLLQGIQQRQDPLTLK